MSAIARTSVVLVDPHPHLGMSVAQSSPRLARPI